MTVHLVRMAVGCASVEELAARQLERVERREGQSVVPGFTRRRPRRAAEIADGGSIYWIVKGAIRARQRILALEDAVDGQGAPYCRLVYDPDLLETVPHPRRPMQGWRYLAVEDAPADATPKSAGDDALPADLARRLSDLGVI